jgi:hypothetical protein
MAEQKPLTSDDLARMQHRADRFSRVSARSTTRWLATSIGCWPSVSVCYASWWQRTDPGGR